MSDNEGQSGSVEATQTTSQSVGESNAKAGEQLNYEVRSPDQLIE